MSMEELWESVGLVSCRKASEKQGKVEDFCRASPSPSPTPTTGISNQGQTCLASARALVWQAEHSQDHS